MRARLMRKMKRKAEAKIEPSATVEEMDVPSTKA